MLIENFWEIKSMRKILEGLKGNICIFIRTKNIFNQKIYNGFYK
jgi:hypothetical protein